MNTCEFLIEDTNEKGEILKENGKPKKVICGKKATTIIRCMNCCPTHYRKLKIDNERRFRWGEEIIARDMTIKKRKKDIPK